MPVPVNHVPGLRKTVSKFCLPEALIVYVPTGLVPTKAAILKDAPPMMMELTRIETIAIFFPLFVIQIPLMLVWF